MINKKNYIIVDVQNHFLEYGNDEELTNDIINYFNRNNIRDNIESITVVYDELFKQEIEDEQLLNYEISRDIQEQITELNIEDFEDEEEFYLECENETDEIIEKLKFYIENKIPYKLALFYEEIKNSEIEIEFVGKEYAYIRSILDEEKYDLILPLFFTLKYFVNIENYDFNLLSEYQNGNEHICKIIDNYMRDSNYNDIDETIKEFQNNLDQISFQFIQNDYKHLSDKKNIIAIGGGQSECLVEEITRLKCFLPEIEIEFKKRLIYGEGDIQNRFLNISENINNSIVSQESNNLSNNQSNNCTLKI